MRLHTGGCADTVRESALKADPGRKIPCHTGDLNPRQNCARLFSRTLYQLSYPRQACDVYRQSSGAVRESRWPFCGRKATLNHAYALVTICPKYINPTSEDIKLHIIIIIIIFTQPLVTTGFSESDVPCKRRSNRRSVHAPGDLRRRRLADPEPPLLTKTDSLFLKTPGFGTHSSAVSNIYHTLGVRMRVCCNL